MTRQDSGALVPGDYTTDYLQCAMIPPNGLPGKGDYLVCDALVLGVQLPPCRLGVGCLVS